MNLNSLTAVAMREAIIHSLASARGARSDSPGIFLDELHRRGFLVVPASDCKFYEPPAEQEPST
jgi:hypothetical protein